MKVVDIMSTAVEFIAGDSSVRDAAQLMGELDVGALPIGTEEALEGIVTDRDLLLRVMANGRDPATTLVRDVKSPDMVTRWEIISCRDTDDLKVALDLMAAAQVRRVPVMNALSRVVGWVTLADVSRKLLIDSREMQRVLTEMMEDDRDAL